jgi:hypothetical protein
VVGLGVVLAGLGVAYSGGVATGDCSGCHGAGDHTMTVTATPASIDPGEQVRVRVTVSSPSGEVVGIFIDADAGSFMTLAGEGLSEVNAGLTHNEPKPLSGGDAVFEFDWTAPGAPGAVRFAISSVVANGNGGSGGDGAADGEFDFVFGCAPQEFFRDVDGDGYGRNDLTLVHCAGAAPPGYAADGDDCDDNRDTVYPGAVEYCNTRDDDCDGEIDEDALPLTQYPDADGDLYYGSEEFRTGKTFVGCAPTEGWAPDPGDCQPNDPAINPGAEEICNGWDDNCDARIDEFVRPRCGEGWCRREAQTCEPDTCTPGEPREEECNLLDDDCDGLLDEDSCEEGFQCRVGVCEPEETVEEGSSSGGGPSSTGDAATSAAVDTDTDAAPATGEAGSCGCSSGTPALGLPWLVLPAFRPRRKRR